MAITEIEIVHIGGKKQTVNIVGFDNTRLMFTYPLCGVYEIIVRTNRIPRAKNWKAVDHEAIRKLHWMLLKEGKVK